MPTEEFAGTRYPKTRTMQGCPSVHRKDPRRGPRKSTEPTDTRGTARASTIADPARVTSARPRQNFDHHLLVEPGACNRCH